MLIFAGCILVFFSTEHRIRLQFWRAWTLFVWLVGFFVDWHVTKWTEWVVHTSIWVSRFLLIGSFLWMKLFSTPLKRMTGILNHHQIACVTSIPETTHQFPSIGHREIAKVNFFWWDVILSSVQKATNISGPWSLVVIHRAGNTFGKMSQANVIFIIQLFWCFSGKWGSPHNHNNEVSPTTRRSFSTEPFERRADFSVHKFRCAAYQLEWVPRPQWRLNPDTKSHYWNLHRTFRYEHGYMFLMKILQLVESR